MLAVHLKRHRRRREASADIGLPQFVERGVVERRNSTVQEPEKHKAAGGCKRARIVWVAQMSILLDLARDRIHRGQIALEALVRGEKAAVPPSLCVVLLPVDRHRHAGGHCRNIDELGVSAVGRWPVVVAARN